MRHKLLIGLAIAGAVAITASVALAAPPKAKNFTAKLSGANEVPANDSKGVGVAVFNLSKGVLKFKLNASNLGSEVVAAHIHCGAKGVNGPIVATLFTSADGTTVAGRFASGTVAVTPVGSSTECPDGVASLEQLLAKMRAGQTYVNVHTEVIPAGEIRGQIRKLGPKKS